VRGNRGQSLSVHVAEYRIYAWSTSSVAPTVYPAGKVNSAGCLPMLESQGVASASSPHPFSVAASQVLNQESGLYFYGFASAALPFQGGVRCVAISLHRTPVQSSGGSPSGQECTGEFAFDMNAPIQSGADPLLTSATTNYGQCWYHDPDDPHSTVLSAALAATSTP
jgi:hypothetical protein